MNQKYLINDICNFEPLFTYDKKIKKNILSACFFKMKNHYKDFNIYVKGLQNLINILNAQDKYILRLFIDENIKKDKNIFDFLYSNKKIELVIFKCNDYLNNSYHIDVFGTFVRFFPIFNFKNNDAKNVICIDIDLKMEDAFYLENLIKETNFKGAQVIGRGTAFELLVNNKNPHFYANLIGFYGVKFDSNILINFIKNIGQIKNNSHYGKRTSNFSFGTDELFLNEYFIYSANNKINFKLGILLDYNINWFLYYTKEDLLKKYPKNSKIYLKYILGKYAKDNLTTLQMFDLVDKYIYTKYANIKYDKEKKVLSSNFYKLINYLYKNNKIWFNKSIIDIIHKYFNGIIYSLSIVYFDKNIHKIKNNSINKIIDVKHIYSK
jgi:hypothetical protein